MGAYSFVADQLRTVHGIEPVYIGRDTAASPAVGSKHVHKDQQEAIISAVVGPSPKADKSKAAKQVHTVVTAAQSNGVAKSTAKPAQKGSPKAAGKPISSKR